jgi:hypothetical protein
MLKNNKIKSPFFVKNNSSSIEYLYYIYAIPKKIRNDYLSQLTSRKKSHIQKNVILLKIILDIVDREDFRWNNGLVCRELGFKNVKHLYWHKSKILRDLRRMYITANTNIPEVSFNVTGTVKDLFNKAEIFHQNGMTRESCALYNHILSKYKNKKKTANDIVNIVRIYERLLKYADLERNVNKYKRYLLRLKKNVSRYKNVLSFTKKELAYISVILLIGGAHQKIHKNKKAYTAKAKLEFERGLELAKKHNLIYHQAFILFQLSGFGSNSLSEKYLTEGYLISKNNNYLLMAYAFKAKLLYLCFDRMPAQKEDKEIYSLKLIFNEAKKMSKINYWTQECFFYYVKTVIKYKPDKFGPLVKKAAKMAFLSSRITLGVYYKNLTVKDFSFSNLSIMQGNNVGLIYLLIDNNELLKHEQTFKTAMRLIKKAHYPVYKITYYKELFYFQYLRGLEFDFEVIVDCGKKISNYFRQRNSNEPEFYYFEFQKIALNMFEESKKFRAEKEIMNKYLKKYSDICDELIQSNYANHGIIYLLITHVANQLGYKDLWDIVYKQWDYLKKNHPLVIKSLYKQLEKQNKKLTEAA